MGSSFIILSMREYMLMAYFLKLKIVRIILHNMYKDITDTTTAYNLVITNHLNLQIQPSNLKHLVNDVFCLETLLLE